MLPKYQTFSCCAIRWDPPPWPARTQSGLNSLPSFINFSLLRLQEASLDGQAELSSGFKAQEDFVRLRCLAAFGSWCVECYR